MSSGVITGNTTKQYLIQKKLTPSLVGAATTSEQTFTVRGLALNDFVEVSKASHDTGISIGNVRVSAVDTIAITYINPTAGGLTPTAENYLIAITRAPTNTLNEPVGD